MAQGKMLARRLMLALGIVGAGAAASAVAYEAAGAAMAIGAYAVGG